MVRLLKLQALEGNVLPTGTTFELNPAGLLTGGRLKGDGKTYLGSQKYKISSRDGQQQLKNDILLNDTSVGERQSMLKYNPSNKRYYLRDLGEGSGTFVKIQQRVRLISGAIVSFSDSHVAIGISEGASNGKHTQQNTLSLRFLEGPKLDQTYSFGKELQTVRIGRMQDCDVKFDGTSLSRYQTSIEFENGEWYVSDGYNGKPSTNGTWIFAEDFFELDDNSIIKIGNTLFQAIYSQSTN